MSPFAHRLIIATVLLCTTSYCQDFDYPDYSNDPPDPSPTSEIIKLRSGDHFIMRCSTHNISAHFVWKFQHCTSEFECHQKEKHMEWRKISTKLPYLTVNGSAQHAGHYRCYVDGSLTKEFKLFPKSIRTSYMDYPPPRIVSLTSPSNTSNGTLTINCLSNSTVQPEVRWFQQCHHGNVCEVQKNNFCYCKARYWNSSNFAVLNRDGLYLSKMKIFKPRHLDAGLYVCLVMTSYGEDYKNVTVKINDHVTLAGGADENRRAFPLLFLIPLGFLLIPVIVWLCYYKRKEASRRAQRKQQELLKPMMGGV